MAEDFYGEFLEGTDIKISISEFKGKNRVDIRKYYDNKGEMAPTQKGVNMTVEDFQKLVNLLPTLQEKILELEKK